MSIEQGFSFPPADRDDLGLIDLHDAEGKVIGQGITTTSESRGYLSPFTEGDPGHPVDRADTHLRTYESTDLTTQVE